MIKNIRIVFLICLVSFISCGCGFINSSTTRDIRHSGFALSKAELECSALLSSSAIDKVRFLTATHAITESGQIYSLSTSQKYSNDQNCKLSSLPFGVTALFDDNIARTSDGKIYYLNQAGGNAAYSLVPINDSNYKVYSLILSDPAVIKVKTANAESGHYYVLKNDGNVYNYVVNKTYDNVSIISNTLVYSKVNYGGDIIDFNYAGKNYATFVRTNTQIFRMKSTNKEECSRYVDVACEYEMRLDEGLTKHRNKIVGFTGTYLITNYGSQFNATA